MTSLIRPALSLLAFFTLATGLVYPSAVTGAATLLFPDEARGSLLADAGRTTGSALVGQPFDDPRYFWGRPSATSAHPYDAAASAGSNLGPTNPALETTLRARVDLLRGSDPSNTAPIPVDLVTSSASGLDPHVSIAAARWQVGRVARARGLDPAAVQRLVDDHAEPRLLGVFGDPRVHVLRLNLALDRVGTDAR